MFEKIRKALSAYGEMVEVILAFFTAIAIAIELIGFIPQFEEFWINRSETENFVRILNGILTIAIGSEFIKMMLKPSMKNITEVLIFLIARHMIIEETTPMDNLISVVSITILFMVQHFLIHSVNRNHIVDNAIGRIVDRFQKTEGEEGEKQQKQ